MSETAEIFARAVIVTRPGRCPFCRRYFKVGQDLIVRVPRRGWMHEGCASAVLQFAPEEPAAAATLSIELRLPGDIDEVTEEILRDELAPVFVSAERDEK